LEATERLLEPEVKRLQQRVVELTRQNIKLDTFQEDLSSIVEMNKRISDEEQRLKVEIEAPSVVSVLEEAVVIRANATKRQALIAGGAGLGGLALVLFGVAWLEYRARRVDGVEEVGELGMRVVGTLPDSLRRAGSLLSSSATRKMMTQDLLTASVDASRAILLYMARQEGLQVVLVTSAVGGEGKTSLVSHLAVSMARAGLKTLLIDGDLRKPAAHELFGAPGVGGLSELLRGEVEAAAVTHPTAVSGLSLLPAGQWDDQAIRALAQGRGGEILAHLRQQYDFILIDSSPVLPVADALLLGQHVDGVLMSVLRQVSRLPAVYATAQRVESLGIRMLGAVLAGVKGDLVHAYPCANRAKVGAKA
jgi:capsular exopolysaccharide synthesis family protein